MPVGVVGAIATVGAAVISSSAQRKAAQAQANAAREAAAAQERSTEAQIESNERIFAQQQETLAPYVDAGVRAQNALDYETGLGERPDGYGGFTATPSYEFVRDQGTRAIDNSAASQGNLFSGATLRAQEAFGQGLASSEYNNFLAQLRATAVSGQNAATGQVGALANLGQGNAAAIKAQGDAQERSAIRVGNALAASAAAQGQIWNNAIGGLTNIYGYQQYQNFLGQQPGYNPQTSFNPFQYYGRG